jgi:hypothetical protein
METDFLAVCRRCGQPVREDHSHVMVVPVGRGRMFFHAGCEPVVVEPDLAEGELKVDLKGPYTFTAINPKARGRERTMTDQLVVLCKSCGQAFPSPEQMDEASFASA